MLRPRQQLLLLLANWCCTSVSCCLCVRCVSATSNEPPKAVAALGLTWAKLRSLPNVRERHLVMLLRQHRAQLLPAAVAASVRFPNVRAALAHCSMAFHCQAPSSGRQYAGSGAILWFPAHGFRRPAWPAPLAVNTSDDRMVWPAHGHTAPVSRLLRASQLLRLIRGWAWPAWPRSEVYSERRGRGQGPRRPNPYLTKSRRRARN